MPLRVVRLTNMSRIRQYSDDIYIKAITIDPEIEAGLFSGATIPRNTAIME
jgi:hypothetical protein